MTSKYRRARLVNGPLLVVHAQTLTKSKLWLALCSALTGAIIGASLVLHLHSGPKETRLNEKVVELLNACEAGSFIKVGTSVYRCSWAAIPYR